MLNIFSEPHIWQFRLFEHQSSLRGEDYRSKKTTGWKVTLWKSKEPRKLIKYMYNFQIKRGNRKSLTCVHCNWNVPFCLLSLKIRGECRDGPWDVFVASQCFGCQVLSNHPGKGTSSLKMSKNEDHFTIFFGKKTFTLYYIQLLLDDPRQIQAARPEPSLFAPPFLTSHQTPQYCTTPAANWWFCPGLGCHCWGPVLPIWIAQSQLLRAEAKELRDACLQSH